MLEAKIIKTGRGPEIAGQIIRDFLARTKQRPTNRCIKYD
jgi:hypothetical protein